MTRVDEAKNALWGQLVDSGELNEDDANVLLDNLVAAARQEGEDSKEEEWWRSAPWVRGYIAGCDARANGLPTSYGDSLPVREP